MVIWACYRKAGGVEKEKVGNPIMSILNCFNKGVFSKLSLILTSKPSCWDQLQRELNLLDNTDPY